MMMALSALGGVSRKERERETLVWEEGGVRVAREPRRKERQRCSFECEGGLLLRGLRTMGLVLLSALRGVGGKERERLIGSWGVGKFIGSEN